MELYFVISVMDRERADKMSAIYSSNQLPLMLTLLGSGTATAEQLDIYGLEATEKALVVSVADAAKTAQVIKSAKQRLFIDIPGNGIIMSVPIKSVGGGRALAILTNNAQPDSAVPKMSFDHELIMIIINEGFTDTVMDAARSAGAAGGTVLHAKGTGASRAEKFFGVSLAAEKEVILIVADATEKTAIMRAVAEQTGPGTPAGAIPFSLPLSAVAGLRAKDSD